MPESFQNSGVSAAPLPPLPDLSAGSGAGMGAGSDSSGLTAIVSGMMPVKTGVDQILAACKQIVQSGVVPGAEQVCGQIVALAAGLMAQATQAGMGMGAGSMGPGGSGPGGLTPGPPPGAPQPIMGQGQ